MKNIWKNKADDKMLGKLVEKNKDNLIHNSRKL